MGYDFRFRYKLGEYEAEIEMNFHPDERGRVAQSIVNAIVKDLGESPREEKPKES